MHSNADNSPHLFVPLDLTSLRSRIIAAGCLTLVILPSSLQAADYTWDGGGGDNNWNTNANWVGDPTTDPNGSDNLTFAGSNRTTSNNDTAANSSYNITFAANAGAFTLTGNAIDITNGGFVTNSSSNDQLVNLNLRLQGNANINSNVAGKTLTIAGGITDNTGNNVALTVGGVGDVVLSGSYWAGSSGSNSLVKTGSGTVTLSGANGYTGGTTISGGTLRVFATGSGANNTTLSSGSISISGGATLLTNTTSNATANIAASIALGPGGATFQGNTGTYLSGAITGGTGATMTGEMILSRASGNNAIGAINVNNGRLHIQNGLHNINGSSVTVANGASLNLDFGGNAEVNPSNTITIQSGGNLAMRLGSQTTTDNPNRVLTVGNNFNLATAGSISFNNDDQLTAKINVTRNLGLTGDLTVQVGGGNPVAGDVTFSGVVSGTGYGLTKTSTGTLILSGGNTFTGGLNINGGTVRIDNASALGSSANAVSVASGATLQLNNNSIAISGLNGAGNVIGRVAGTGSSTLTVNKASGTDTFSGVISNGSGTLGLTKTGAGTLVLSGSNTYTGATAVSQGTLVINGNQSAATGALTVASGAKLSGTGTVGGATTIQNGGTHAVGTTGTIGTQTFSNGVTYSSGSIFSWDLNVTTPTSTASTTTYDKVVGAAAGSGATFAIVLAEGQSFSDAYWNVGHTWTDVFSSGTLSSIFTSFGGSVASNGLVAGEGQFSFSGGTLTWSAIPEASTALAGILLAAGLFHRRRSTQSPTLA